MVQAGASIEAFLKLDATQFQGSIDKSISAVKSFKESMIDIGKNARAVESGLNVVTRSIDQLNNRLILLEEKTKAVGNFKTFSMALEHMATAAQRLGNVTKEGGASITAMSEIIKVWASAVSSAEAPIIRVTQSIRTLSTASKESAMHLSESQQILRNQFTLLENTLSRNNVSAEQFSAVTQKLRHEYGLTGEKLVQVRNQLLQTTQATVQYAEALVQPRTRTQEFLNTLSQSNSTLANFSNNLTRVNASLGNFSNSVARVNANTSTLKSQTGQWIGTLNSSDGTIQRATSGVVQYGNALQIPTKYMMEGGATTERYRVLQKGVNLTVQDNINTIQRQSDAIRANAAEKLRAMGYTGRLSAEETKLNTSTSSSASSMQRQSSAIKSANASTTQLASSTNMLGRAMSSLRMVGTMVASMMVWNFASSLVNATRETVNAKSEMEGYFQMLHFSRDEIKDFNNALDDTVKQFQRVNKYSLGETISSIGVEFNLSTEEMKKAMKVTSMVTSEYLRAGRNANEASLAVKDVLQGQFQRLSRETGVKGEQLKDAGWSGDNQDVLSLMEALEKVGKSRNWDVFASKANSLNDMVLILQNRFGEWSAEMVNVVQPSIIGTFNAIMSVGSQVGQILSGVWEWINGDGIANQVVKWGLLATAIGSVVTALTVYRTGANLVQLVQMGLRSSILATVLGLKAEEVANYGSRNSIVARMTSIKAETVAEMGVRKAILSKILGLNAEKVAEVGLQGAILQSAFAREYEALAQEGASVADLEALALKYKLMQQEITTTQAIWLRIFGLKAETVAEKGVIVALAERVASSPLYIGSLKAEEIAELSTAEAALVLAGTLAPLIAIFTGLAIAAYSVIAPLQQASEQMKSFNSLVQDGDEMIKSERKTVDSYTKRVNGLKEELGKLTEGTKEHTRKSKELESVQHDLDTATKNYNNTVEAVQLSRSAQLKFEERATEIAIEGQTKLEDAYIKAGFSAREASVMSSNAMIDAKNGAEQLRKALQMLKFESEKGTTKQTAMIDRLKQYGLDKDSIKKYGTAMSEANAKISEGLEKFMTSDDLMERIGGWFELQQGRLEQWWTEFMSFFEVRDWEGMGKLIHDGFLNMWKMVPWNNLFYEIGKSISEKGLITTLMNALFGEGDSDGALDIAWQFLNDCVITPLGKALKNFIDDPIKAIGDFEKGLDESIGKFLFGKDAEPIDEIIDDWFNATFIDPLKKKIEDFKNDPIGTIGESRPFTDGIIPILFGENPSISEMIDGLTDYFANIDWETALNEAITNAISFLSGGVDIIAMILDLLMPQGAYASDGSSDHPSFLEDLKVGFGIDIQAFIDGLTTDPIGFLGLNLGVFDIGAFISSIIMPNVEGIWTWVDTNIIQPFSTGIADGIASIPIIGDILSMLGLIPSTQPDAQTKGTGVGNAFGTSLLTVIGNIPIVGDILKLLGLIPQTNPTANSNGKGVGDNVKSGYFAGTTNLVSQAIQEFTDLIGAIANKAREAYNAAKGVGDAIWSGINSVLQRASPGFIHDQVLAEFGTDIPSAIEGSGINAYETAQGYGQQIYDGINSVKTVLGFGDMVEGYESDAQIIATTSEMMGLDTTTAFNNMSLAVTSTTNTMQGNVVSSYSTMQQKQNTLLTNMKNSNTTAYNEMYNKSNQSLLQMRTSTENVTQQMIKAWSHMKDQIVATANKLKNDATAHFNKLSETIGSFYRKIQNPSNWGAGPHKPSNTMTRTSTNPTAGRRVASMLSGAGGGRSSSGGKHTGSTTMSIAQIKKLICPNGDCNGLFDGYSATDRVNVEEFLAMVGGEHGFGWNDWSGTHYNYIKNKSDQWSMKSPVIQLMGGIPTNANFKVGEFNNGTPSISFSEFQSMAGSIFSAIPYRMYYDSSWKGSWLGALQAGACNCSDGADALIAFAHTCGFSGYKQWGLWGNTGHFWAVINGVPMDTTAWQGGYGWTSPKVRGYGGADVMRANHTPKFDNTGGKIFNITIEMNNSNIYGVDDLDDRIKGATKEAMREEFNDPYGVAL